MLCLLGAIVRQVQQACNLCRATGRPERDAIDAHQRHANAVYRKATSLQILHRQRMTAATKPHPLLDQQLHSIHELMTTDALCASEIIGKELKKASLQDSELPALSVLDLSSCNSSQPPSSRETSSDCTAVDADFYAARPGLEILQVGWHPGNHFLAAISIYSRSLTLCHGELGTKSWSEFSVWPFLNLVWSAESRRTVSSKTACILDTLSE